MLYNAKAIRREPHKWYDRKDEPHGSERNGRQRQGNPRHLRSGDHELYRLCAGKDYQLRPQKFERIRRITGYLVGTIDRWNDAKRAEEHDRVKHGLH